MEEVQDKIRNFTDLIAWKEGHKLVLSTYRITKKFPSSEAFGLTNQMRRCSVSITSNIAEGFSRGTDKDKRQFYSIALGSLRELENQLIISHDIGYISDAEVSDIQGQIVRVSKLISGLKKIGNGS